MPENNDALSQIEWPAAPALKDPVMWDRNVKIVQLLCRIGEVTKWQDGDGSRDLYTHMPYHYNVGGVLVSFLPHWNYYAVGGINLNVPETEEDVLKAVSAAKDLIALGLKQKN